MEFLMKEQIVEAVGYEAVPPAEVVAYQKDWPAFRIDAAVKPDIMKLTAQAITRIKAEKADKEGYVSGFDHFGAVTEINDLWGLR